MFCADRCWNRTIIHLVYWDRIRRLNKERTTDSSTAKTSRDRKLHNSFWVSISIPLPGTLFFFCRQKDFSFLWYFHLCLFQHTHRAKSEICRLAALCRPRSCRSEYIKHIKRLVWWLGKRTWHQVVKDKELYITRPSSLCLYFILPVLLLLPTTTSTTISDVLTCSALICQQEQKFIDPPKWANNQIEYLVNIKAIGAEWRLGLKGKHFHSHFLYRQHGEFTSKWYIHISIHISSFF